MEIKTKVHANNLVEWARHRPEVVVLSADLTGSTEIAEFQAAYPDRFFSMGIAEQNMVSFAAGLAREGFIPLIHTFAVFIYRQALNQINLAVMPQISRGVHRSEARHERNEQEEKRREWFEGKKRLSGRQPPENKVNLVPRVPRHAQNARNEYKDTSCHTRYHPGAVDPLSRFLKDGEKPSRQQNRNAYTVEYHRSLFISEMRDEDRR